MKLAHQLVSPENFLGSKNPPPNPPFIKHGGFDVHYISLDGLSKEPFAELATSVIRRVCTKKPAT